MLKLSIVVAAALLGTAAIAQEATTNSPAESPSGAMPSDSSMAAPATDSAAPASTDAGMTQGAGTASDATATGAARTYPRCSRTVTDSCIQGGARSRR